MSFIWYILMVVGLGGMIWCAKAQKRIANAKIYAIVCLVLIVISAIMALVNEFGPDPETKRFSENEKQFTLARLSRIAEFVNKNYAGRKVAILIHQNDIPNSTNSQWIRVDKVKELKSFLKGVTVLDPVIIKPVTNGNEEAAEDLSLSNENLDKMFDECKALQPDVVIYLSGFSEGTETKKLKVWKWKGKNEPKLILAGVSDINAIRPKALKEDDGVLEAVVMSRITIDKSKFDPMKDNAPKDLKEAFDVQYVLVTKENFESLLKDKVIEIP